MNLRNLATIGVAIALFLILAATGTLSAVGWKVLAALIPWALILSLLAVPILLIAIPLGIATKFVAAVTKLLGRGGGGGSHS